MQGTIQITQRLSGLWFSPFVIFLMATLSLVSRFSAELHNQRRAWGTGEGEARGIHMQGSVGQVSR